MSCDTSDIPQEGVPLSDGNEPVPGVVDASGSSTAGQTFQSPIDSNRQSPLTDGAVGTGRQQASSNNVHYYPQGQQPEQGLNRYTPEESYNPDAYAPQGQYQGQYDQYDPDYGTGYDQYDQYEYDYTGYANRKRRSLFGKSNKPVKVMISRNAATNTTLLKMVPILKNRPNGKWLYDLKHGDPRLFSLNTNNPSLFYLSTARKMEVGKYILGITGDYRRNVTESALQKPTSRVQLDSLVKLYDEPLFQGVHLNLKVVVTVV